MKLANSHQFQQTDFWKMDLGQHQDLEPRENLWTGGREILLNSQNPAHRDLSLTLTLSPSVAFPSAIQWQMSAGRGSGLSKACTPGPTWTPKPCQEEMQAKQRTISDHGGPWLPQKGQSALTFDFDDSSTCHSNSPTAGRIKNLRFNLKKKSLTS